MKKFVSWNVNGIRACAGKGFLDWLREENADFVCLQETKAHPDQLPPELRNPVGRDGKPYAMQWASAKRRGYSGTAIFSKREPSSVASLGIPEFDDEGRSVVADFDDFVLVSAYFPNSQDAGLRIDYKIRFCDAILALCDNLRAKGRHVIVAGDYNIAHRSIDLARPEQNVDNPGYLPEERGLYKKQTVMESLRYMATLKGVSVTDERIEEMLKHVGMLPHKNKKIEEMSRGMGQLIQFLVTVIHNPALVILDEPFSGLDPVNTELLKGLILELKEQGESIIFSTHQMNQVEELCDRLFMINKGTEVLYGNLNDIKHKYRDNSVFITYEGDIGSLKGVTDSRQKDGYTEFILDSNTTPQDILQQLIDKRVTVNRFEIGTPSLHEIFIRIAGVNGDGNE
jgi:exodeoxyribonuclease III